MKYKTKIFINENYFVLYDSNDCPICYFDNFYELAKHINYSVYDLVKRFNKYGDSINIIIGNKLYKLVTFVD